MGSLCSVFRLSSRLIHQCQVLNMGDCEKCGFNVDDGDGMYLEDKLLHRGCWGRGSRNTAPTMKTTPKTAVTMESADKAVGALYVIMDVLKRKKEVEREE